MPATVRRIRASDAAAFEAFLAPLADSSLFLLANARKAGFTDSGRPFEGTYSGAFEGGRLLGVAAHFWNGILALQAPGFLPEVVRHAVSASGRAVAGLTGPDKQVVAARAALGFSSRPAALEEPEGLFALDLGDLRVPEALSSGRLQCRRPRPEELSLLALWRAAYRQEVLGEPPGRASEESAREDVQTLEVSGSHWVLEEKSSPVATTAFNARLSEIVQVGGVWTPPALRGRGYARSAVAGSLLTARAEGTGRAVLFTENPAAVKAYEAIGFRRVGDYGLVIFREG
jgi:uncharacterized protein